MAAKFKDSTLLEKKIPGCHVCPKSEMEDLQCICMQEPSPEYNNTCQLYQVDVRRQVGVRTYLNWLVLSTDTGSVRFTSTLKEIIIAQSIHPPPQALLKRPIVTRSLFLCRQLSVSLAGVYHYTESFLPAGSFRYLLAE